MNEVSNLIVFAPFRGPVGDLIGATFGIAFGAIALYFAYKGLWHPGRRYSTQSPIKAPWYLRVFLVAGALFFLYFGWDCLSHLWSPK